MTCNVRDYGAKGDGITDDAPAFRDAIAAARANGGGTVMVPAHDAGKSYKWGSAVVIDHSADPGRFNKLVDIEGEGSPYTNIDCSAVSEAALVVKGNPTAIETHFTMRGIRMSGNPIPVQWTRGLDVDVSAFMHLEDVTIEGFYFGIMGRDVDQSLFERCNIRWNSNGMYFAPHNLVTDPNSLTFVETAICNNSLTGLTVNNVNALTFIGGSIQYCGSVHGNQWHYGVKLQNGGTGYNGATFVGTVWEGNIGIADLWSRQDGAGNPMIVNLDGNSFMRSTPTNYANNCLLIDGGTKRHLARVVATSFRSANGYVPSASRKFIAIPSSAGVFVTDGSNYYEPGVEAP